MTKKKHVTGDNSTSPDDITVHDKASFRRWCAAMMFNAKQASVILRVSLPMMYKYLDPDRDTKIRAVTALSCNLISEKPAHERLQWIQKQLADAKCKDAWPAESPIKTS